MTRVIKAGDTPQGLVIAPFALPRATEVAATPIAVRSDPRDAEIARLEALVAEHDAEIARLAETSATARAEGEEAGRLAAELDFTDDREAALTRLEAGIEAARAALGDWRDHAETLALLVARTALDKLFAGDAAREAAVVDLVRRQLAGIERETVLAVTVSRLDFPDTREVAALAARMGLDPALLAVSDELAAGACRMKLRLGTLDLGLDTQWGAVRGLLDAMAGLSGEGGEAA